MSTSQQPAQPLYLGAGTEGVFAFFNDASGDSRDAALICPPFGWDLMCPYRARRDWAEHLAARGHPVLRIDLPSTGDSSGSPGDPARLQAWTSAVTAAALWLRSTTSTQRILAIGIGLGGILAHRAAAAHAPIDDLVLWGVPAHGRTLVRELRALSRLSGVSMGETEEVEPAVPRNVPDGALLAAGYLLSAETVSSLEQVDLAQEMLPNGASRRVLMLGRGGTSVDASLRTSLSRAGASVAVAAGPGRERLRETFAQVDRWLAHEHAPQAGTPSTSGPPTSVPTARSRAREQCLSLTTHGTPLHERPVYIDGPRGRLFGVLAEPAGEPRDLCAVLLNAGPQRHIGPNRMWVEIARRWAARGVPSLRIDLSCVGDSDGDGRALAIPGVMYSSEYVEETIAALDWLQARQLPSRFLTLGLCAGAYWSLYAALRDRRIASIVLLNPRRLIWDPHLARAWRRQQRMRRLLTAASLGMLTRARERGGYVEPAEEPEEGRPTRLSRLFMPWRSRQEPAARLDRLFAALHARDQRALLMLTSAEPLYEQLSARGVVDRSVSWPGLELVAYHTAVETHTLAPLWLQHELHQLLDRTLLGELERLGSLEHDANVAPMVTDRLA